MFRLVLLLCAIAFWLSGASALTYEILWQREMFLVFGASAPATTAILTAIFLGIAFGSQFAIPVMRRFRNPLLLYAGLEALLGLWGVLVPSILQLADHLYVASVAAIGEGHPLQFPLRFVLAIIPLLPATLAMGATIPVMIRCISRVTASAAAWAYGINILGAVAGCLLTGFLWIRLLGMLDTRLVAAAMNAAAVLVVLGLNRLHRTSWDDPPVKTEAAGQGPRGLAAAYFVTGFVALGLEVVWLRFLGIVNTNSSATFTLTLAIYLLGMGSGSLFLYPALKRWLKPGSIFSLANGGTALASLLTFGVLYDAARINQEQIVDASAHDTLTLAGIYQTEARIIASLMLLPTLFMGLAYPAVCDSFPGGGAHRDRWNSRSYFLGTLGSVLGILLIATLLIPRLGLHGSFSLLVCLSLGICVASLYSGRVWRKPWPLAVGVLCLVGAAWSVSLAVTARPVLHETLAVKRSGTWLEVAVRDPRRVISELIRFQAGTTATVIVKKTPGLSEHQVYVDDQLVASTNLGARVDAFMLAHLPLLLHPQPDVALTVGFGTGGTSHAMTTHDVQTYCVEIEPEVPRSAFLMPEQNFGVLEDPRFSLILNDARDHLHSGTRTYDVIATDVTNLQYKQNGNLYTVEYFQLMQQKLDPDGIACAWIPMAAIELRELRILMKSFQDVFPHATLWFINHTHTNFGILIGTPEPLQIDYRRLEQGFADAEIAENLRLIGMISPLQFIHSLHLDEVGYREFCGDVPVHTDDRPILEFSSPMSFYRYYETFGENLSETLAYRPRTFRRFVSHLPDNDTLDAEFERHAVASQSFCEFLVLMYDYIVAEKRQQFAGIRELVAQALRVAESGMEAWPGDATRKEFYVNFFRHARRWLPPRPESEPPDRSR